MRCMFDRATAFENFRPTNLCEFGW